MTRSLRLVAGEWSSRRAALVVGGGPSANLAGIDLELVARAVDRRKLGIVGANRAYLWPVPPAAVVSCDPGFWHKDGTRPELGAYVRAGGVAVHVRAPGDIGSLRGPTRSVEADGELDSLGWGSGERGTALRRLGCGSSSGFAAANLADFLLGDAGTIRSHGSDERPLVLLGFDGAEAPGWWHDGWEDARDRPRQVFDRFARGINAIPMLSGRTTLNASPSSSYALPRVDLEAFLRGLLA